jgi:uncharacterized protein
MANTFGRGVTVRVDCRLHPTSSCHLGGFTMSGKRVGVLTVLLAGALVAGMNFSAEGQDKKAGVTEKKGDTAKAPAKGLTFEIYKDKGNEYRYRLVDEKGVNLGGSGKGYDSHQAVLQVVETIKKGAPSANIEFNIAGSEDKAADKKK